MSSGEGVCIVFVMVISYNYQGMFINYLYTLNKQLLNTFIGRQYKLFAANNNHDVLSIYEISCLLMHGLLFWQPF